MLMRWVCMVAPQSLERARRCYGKSHGGRPPTGGCWDLIGYKELLRMEQRITGVSYQRGKLAAPAPVVTKPAARKAAQAAAAVVEEAAKAKASTSGANNPQACVCVLG